MESITNLSVHTRSPFHALIIGIDNYAASPRVPNLHGAVADTDAMCNYVHSRHHVPASQIRCLRNAEATRTAFIDAIQSLASDDGIQKGDTILIYYAGHGTTFPSPAKWEQGGKIQCLVPYDCFTEVNGNTVSGIPDYTIRELLEQLAEAKGDNITVILDCCYSGSGTRNLQSRARGFRLKGDLEGQLPEDLDTNILVPETGDRATNFSFSGLRSHVLLAACGSQETAYEDDEGGAFTRMLLSEVNVADANDTYRDLIKRMRLPRRQNPQCEGSNADRVLFKSGVDNRHISIYPLQTVVHTLRLHAQVEVTGFACAFSGLEQQLQDSFPGQPHIVLVERQDADVAIVHENGQIVFHILDNVSTGLGLTRIHQGVKPQIESIIPLIQSAALYYSALRVMPRKESLRNHVEVEFTQLVSGSSKQAHPAFKWVPDGRNLIDADNRVDLEVDEKSCYGLRIVNTSDDPLYASILSFNNSDFSFDEIYHPSISGGCPDPSIDSKGSLCIGYGSGGAAPLQYSPREGQALNVSFIRLFLSKKPIELRHPPTSVVSSSNALPHEHSVFQLLEWDAITITVVQHAPKRSPPSDNNYVPHDEHAVSSLPETRISPDAFPPPTVPSSDHAEPLHTSPHLQSEDRSPTKSVRQEAHHGHASTNTTEDGIWSWTWGWSLRRTLGMIGSLFVS